MDDTLGVQPFVAYATRGCTGRLGKFLESLHANFGAHWDHEPEIRNLFGIKPTIFRFMERVESSVEVWLRVPKCLRVRSAHNIEICRARRCEHRSLKWFFMRPKLWQRQ